MNRPGASDLRYLAAAAIGTALIVGAFFVFAPGHRKPSVEPNVGPLKDVLERSAEKVLPPPTLASEEIVLMVPNAERDQEIERLLALATKLGGTALRSESPEGAVEILAQIPVGNASAFRAQATGGEAPAPPQAAPGDDTTSLIVVKFRGTAVAPSASPAP